MTIVLNYSFWKGSSATDECAFLPTFCLSMSTTLLNSRVERTGWKGVSATCW